MGYSQTHYALDLLYYLLIKISWILSATLLPNTLQASGGALPEAIASAQSLHVGKPQAPQSIFGRREYISLANSPLTS